jgi:rfaE bifunctional protein nucleotidyltransferase chain/domain
MSARDKVETLDRIVARLRAPREGSCVVQAHGVFDLLHLGHVRHLEAARAMGDMLVVTVTADRYVNKGPGRPAFSEMQRAEVLAALDCVNWVAISGHPTAVGAIRAIRPDVFVKGSESRGAEGIVGVLAEDERKAVESYGGKVAFTDEVVMSSTSIINRHLPIFDNNTTKCLSEIRDMGALPVIGEAIRKISNYKITFVGDTIIDEYEYVKPVGKSLKANMLSTKHSGIEQFVGGVVAAANHLSSFCQSVDVVTNEQSAIRKRRFVDQSNMEKLFEVSYSTDQVASSLSGEILEKVGNTDVFVVTDFGHGAISKESIGLLQQHAPFLAVNCQTNTLNQGFNLVTKYASSDYICIDLPEARLATHDRDSDPEDISRKLMSMVKCSQIIITQGKEGCVVNDNGAVSVMPALAGKVVDTIGAGDAFFAVTAPLVAAGLPLPLCGFVGNIVGGLKVRTVGNRESVHKHDVMAAIASLLK